jgi:hypothetical protein
MKLSPADIGFRVLDTAGVPASAARRLAPLGFAIALLALLAAFYGLFRAGWAVFDWWNDRGAVEDATGKANADFTQRQIKVERKGGADKNARDAADAGAQRDLQEDLDDASDAGDSGADAVWTGGLWADPKD